MAGLKRPYKVPLPMAGLLIMCLIPSGFLIYIMASANKIVYLVSAVLTFFAILWYFLMKLCKSKQWIQFEQARLEEENEVED